MVAIGALVPRVNAPGVARATVSAPPAPHADPADDQSIIGTRLERGLVTFFLLAIVNGKGDMGLVAELPVPVAMMERALALDEAWGEGALHEFFVSYLATRSAAEGGGPERVKAHLDRALALSMNKKVGPRVAYAEGYLVQAQDRAAFTATLEEVLSVDPNASPRHRLVNVLSQRRARQLLDHVDDLFL